MPENNEIEEIISQIIVKMDALLNDTTVPKNVRGAVSTAKSKLNEKTDRTVRVSNAIYSIDEVSNDINLPPQARTTLWSILSMLEAIKN